MSFHTMQDIDVTAVVAYPAVTAPDTSLAFEPMEFFIQNMSADVLSTVQVSFNGVDTHFELVKQSPSEGIRVFTKSKKVWFRRGVIGAGMIAVRVSASAP